MITLKLPLTDEEFMRIASENIELASPSDNIEELQQKMQEYIENGVVLGWLIDPKTRRVEVYHYGHNKETLESPVTLSSKDVLSGFVLNLQSIY